MSAIRVKISQRVAMAMKPARKALAVVSRALMPIMNAAMAMKYQGRMYSAMAAVMAIVRMVRRRRIE